MIQTNRIFEVSQALEIDYYGSFIIPFTFSKSQRQLIVTITNASNYNQQKMGEIIPFTEYGIGGQLNYFQKSIYAGNNYLETSAIDDYKLKFKPYKNGNYFITIDEIIDSDFELMKANLLAPISQGRLTLTSNTPVLSSNVTNATTIFYTPYNGSEISIWDGSKWVLKTFTELSLSLSGLPANTNYDVFVFDKTGTLTLEAVAWSNSGAGTSTRASALSWLNGVRVKDSDKRKYLGSFICNGSGGQIDFVSNVAGTAASNGFFNEYNKQSLILEVLDNIPHTYTTSSWRVWGNNANNVIKIVSPSSNISVRYRYSVDAYGNVMMALNGVFVHVSQSAVSSAMHHSGGADINITNGYNEIHLQQYGYTANSNYDSLRLVASIQY